MKKLLSILILLCTSCAEKAHTLPSPEFWKTATLEDVDHAVTDGLDVNARDSDYKTALMFAAEYNTNPNVVEHLVKLGANVNAWGFWGCISDC